MRHEGRANSYERGYNVEWRRARDLFLKKNPWCFGCEAIGVRRKADIVDHIVPHRGDELRFWNVNNWQSCCSWHHNSIKPELERLFKARQITYSELHLQSATAVKLTRQKHRPTIGIDGFAVPNT